MSMLPANIEIEDRGRCAVVRFASDQLAHTEMDDVCVELMERMRLHNINTFVLDFTGVNFIASACIGSLVAFLQDIEPMHGRLALACCQQEVAFLFKVTRLDNIFPMFEDVDDAVAELE